MGGITGKGPIALGVIVCASLFGCSKDDPQETRTRDVHAPLAKWGNPDLVATVGPYSSYGQRKISDRILSGELHGAGSLEFKSFFQRIPERLQRSEAISDGIRPRAEHASSDAVSKSLVLAFPIKFLGEQYLFGGVVTRVGDKENEDLGMLKLLELSPLHVRPILTGSQTDSPQLSLVGCAKNCSEGSEGKVQLNIPVLGVDSVNGFVMLDLSAIGQKLNIISIYDPTGQQTELIPHESHTSTLDYSGATLVFDVESEMIPVKDGGTIAQVVPFTFRWYLKPASGFDPAFEQRPPVADVGFFMTERAATSRITRWALSGAESDTVHYYIKNVPAEYREPFKLAIADWNEKLRPVLDKNLISYEFVEVEDPRYNDIIAGDIRFNVIEWDIDNKAPYGGFGPSIANQYTGEIFSANVLIQGPTILELYKTWFQVSQLILALQSEGRHHEAEAAQIAFHRKYGREKESAKVRVQMGNLTLKVGASLPPLQDPKATRGHFEIVPAGETFESYMRGYFREMVAHEIGHNLGLRHNFRGNLSDDGSRKEGSTSNSVMEYLGRNFRHLNRVSEYDIMAMAYGYRGQAPSKVGIFCTDENVITPMNMKLESPECSRDDATSDPYGFQLARLGRVVDLLINRGSPEAPLWRLEDLEKEYATYLLGLAYYAGASGNVSRWTNFIGDGRPSDSEDVRAYVLRGILDKVCDPGILEEIAKKANEEAINMTIQNVADLKAATVEVLSFFDFFKREELTCP